MKKLLALFLALTMAVGLVACGTDGSLPLESTAASSSAETAGSRPDIVPEDEESSSALPESSEILVSTVTSSEPEASLPPETVSSSAAEPPESVVTSEEVTGMDETGWYYSKEDVSLYLYTYGHLPENFITKNKARELGWEGGSVEPYAPGCAIGGDTFGNREGILPKASGRVYYECDIDTDGRNSRGARRIVFSNDGLIYYTDDHYETFTLLYGEE